MRNCLLPLLVLLLLAANGYAIYHLLVLRQEVADLRVQVTALGGKASAAGTRAAAPPDEALTASVRAALEAARRGDLPAARRELDEFQARLARTESLAAARKAELERSAARARRALERTREEASGALQRLLRDLPPRKEPPKG